MVSATVFGFTKGLDLRLGSSPGGAAVCMAVAHAGASVLPSSLAVPNGPAALINIQSRMTNTGASRLSFSLASHTMATVNHVAINPINGSCFSSMTHAGASLLLGAMASSTPAALSDVGLAFVQFLSVNNT